MKKLDIVFEDEAVVIVNKPSGMLSIPDRFGLEKDNLLARLRNKFESIYTVHRLDKETSGILCFARTEEAHKDLSRQFEKRTVKKLYLTLLDGHLHQEAGILDKPIAPHPVIKGKMMIATKGKPSVTHWKVIERFQNYSLVEADIKTGRTHQIRVHFEAMGYPLAVDAVYGRKEAFYVSELKHKRYKSRKFEEERPLISRSILHASKLQLAHPYTKEVMTFEAPLPKDFKAVLQQLRKWGK